MPMLEILHDFSSPALQTIVHQSSCVDSCVTKWKIIFAAILFLESLIFGHLVYAIKVFPSITARQVRIVLHMANAFSGGVFFTTGMLHIFPESIEIFSGEHGEEENQEAASRSVLSALLRQGDELDEEHEEGGFPWPFFVLLMSFYFFFFVEQVALPKLLNGKDVCALENSSLNETDLEHEPDHDHGQLDKANHFINPFSSDKAGFKSANFSTAVVQILGISAHSLFESMALGLSHNFTTVTNIFIATALHRGFTSVALSIRIVDKIHYWAFLSLLILFSLIVPLGIGIGFAIKSVSSTVHGILFSISAGTFIYIGAYEVMAEEFAKHTELPFTKFGMTILGAGLITVITGVLVALGIHA